MHVQRTLQGVFLLTVNCIHSLSAESLSSCEVASYFWWMVHMAALPNRWRPCIYWGWAEGWKMITWLRESHLISNSSIKSVLSLSASALDQHHQQAKNWRQPPTNSVVQLSIRSASIQLEITIFYFIVCRWMCMMRGRTPAPYRPSISPRPHRSTLLYKVSGTPTNTSSKGKHITQQLGNG